MSCTFVKYKPFNELVKIPDKIKIFFQTCAKFT